MGQEVQIKPSMRIGGGDASTILARGTAETFKITAEDVGDVSHMIVRLAAPEGKGNAPHSSWYINNAKVCAHTHTHTHTLARTYMQRATQQLVHHKC